MCGAKGDLLKSKFPYSNSYADNLGIMCNACSMFNVTLACFMSRNHNWNGKAGSMEHISAAKWLFHMWIAHLAALNW